MAFTPNVTPTFVRQPNMGLTQITTGTGSSTFVTVYTGGSSNGTKVIGITAAGFGTTAAFDVQWGVRFNSSTFYGMGTAPIAAGSGSSSTLPAVNLMSNSYVPGLTVDSDGNPFFFLRSSQDELVAKTPATSSTWAAGTVISIAAIVGDF